MKKKQEPKPVSYTDAECVGIELSPDKWEEIYIKFRVADTDNPTKYRREDVVLPRVTTRIVPDKDTGELVEKQVNAFSNGHFTAHFERKAANAAVEKFFPGYKEDVALFSRLRSLINATAERLKEHPEKLDEDILNLREKLEVYDSMSLDQEQVWKMYLGTIYTIHRFGREAGDNLEA